MKGQIGYQIKVSTITAIVTYLVLTAIFILLLFHTPVSFWTNLFTIVGIDIPGVSSTSAELTLEEIWKHQSSLYELIITTLMGINAATAILAFIYMHGKAKEEAEEKVKEYLNGAEFEKIWKKKNEDFSPELESFEVAAKRIEQLSNEMDDLQRKIRVLSRKIANLDNSEEEQADSILVNEVNNGIH